MKDCAFEDSLALAETACANHIHKTTGMTVCVATNDKGLLDCGVFDIGFPQTGERAIFKAEGYHFRAKLDVVSRKREDVQRAVMRLLKSFPINADTNAADQLRETSNVVVFRLAPQTQFLSEIATVDVQQAKDSRTVRCWGCTALFDVVFIAKRTES